MSDLRKLPQRLTRAKRKAFLLALEEGAMVSKACEAIGVSKQAVYKLRNRDAEFARLWDEHLGRSIIPIEDEITRRGVYGTDKPVYQGGKLVGYVREYSDQCLLALAKRRDPDHWKDRTATEMTVKPQDILAGMMPTEVEQRLAAIMSAFLKRQKRLNGPETAPEEPNVTAH